MTHVTVPDADLLAAIQPLPEGITASVWRLEPELTPEVERAALVVLPPTRSPEKLKVLQRLPELRHVHTLSTGYDDVIAHVPAGVQLVCAAGVHDAATGELAVGLVIATLRGIDDAVRDQGSQQWRPGPRGGVADTRILVIGVGGIGRAVAERLVPFEASLTAVGTRERDVELAGRPWHVEPATRLPELLPQHDVVVLACPLTEQTRGMVDATFLASMPDGALLVNVARGAVVDTDALLAELTSGRLHAALDVVDPEPLPAGHALWEAPNLLLTPHVGSNITSTPARFAALLRDQVDLLAAGRPLRNVVALPS